MEEDRRNLEIQPETITTPTAAPRRSIPRPLRTHVWVTAAVLCVLVGAGFRFVATSDASGAGNGPASTACAAK
jgi:hypothetical protein